MNCVGLPLKVRIGSVWRRASESWPIIKAAIECTAFHPGHFDAA